MLLVDHIGNDLSRIENEIEKILVNLGKRKTINEDDIEEFIGISKEFNVFEFQNALANKDLPGCVRIVQYFEANTKAAPIQLIFPSLYSFYSIPAAHVQALYLFLAQKQQDAPTRKYQFAPSQ